MSDKRIRFFLELAKQVATQGTCPRAQVGAVLVQDNRVVSMGYNGAPRSTPHCTTDGCWMEPRYADKETCVRAVHAELNAILNAAYHGAKTAGSYLACTHAPCINCLKAIINAGITDVVYLNEYDDVKAENLMALAKGIRIYKY